MTEDTILFISNGYGEDTIASTIIKGINEYNPDICIKALPLVGEGRAYKNTDAEIVGPRRLMPSGGMIPGNIMNLVRDFIQGLGRLTIDQITTIRAIKPATFLTLAVGDIYPVIMAHYFSKKPVVMIGTAKSNYFYHYNNIERAIIRSACSMVFTRDEITAENLRSFGIAAKWFGNVMMDSLDVTGADFGLVKDLPCIGILPGSRSEAFKDIVVIMEAVEELWRLLDKKVSFVMAVPDSIDVSLLAESIECSGWKMTGKNGTIESGGMIDNFVKDDIRVSVTNGLFGDVIHCSNIIIGQAGTGNEQAVGMGKPVVTFDSTGNVKMGWYRKRQKGLLGDSISVVPRNSKSIADEVGSLLNDSVRYEKMKNIGFERMGPPGATGKIIAFLKEQFLS